MKNPADVVWQSKDGAWSLPLTHRRDKGGDVATGFWAIRAPGRRAGPGHGTGRFSAATSCKDGEEGVAGE